MAISDGGECEALEELPEPTDPISFDLPRRNLRAGFTVLDGVSLSEIFARRAVVMRSIPKCFRGAYVAAVRVSIHEILDGKASGHIQREVCGWKLFFLLPRLLLFRPLRGGLVSKRQLHERMALFNAGDWAQLLLESNSIAEAGTQAAVQKRRQHVQDDISRRAARAERLALLGELSAGRQALEGATIAHGNLSTLRAPTNPIRRPAAPREPLHEDLTRYVPEHEFQLYPDVFFANVRSARRGTAAGPSGMTADHVRPLLESERDSEVLAELGASLARGEGPQVVWEAIRMGQMTALRKAGPPPKTCLSHHSTTDRKVSGGRDVAIPICAVDQSRERVCQSHIADPH